MKLAVRWSSINSLLLILMWLACTIFKLQTTSINYWSVFWLFFAALSVMMIVLEKRRGCSKKKNSAAGLLIGLIIWSLVSTLINWISGTDNNYSYTQLITDNFIQLLLPVAVIGALGKRASGEKVLFFYKVLMIGMSIWGIFDYVTRTQLYAPLIKTEQGLHNMNTFFNAAKNIYRLTLIFYHPIYYALLLTLGVIVLLYFPFRNKVVQYFSVCLLGINIILTQTRSAWICVVMCVLLCLVKKWKNNNPFRRIPKKKIVAILFFVVAVFIASMGHSFSQIYSELSNLISERIGSLFLGNGTDIRLANIYVVSNIIVNNPYLLITGGGLMYVVSYLQNHPTLGYWSSALDNQYLTMLINYGIVGLCIYIALLIQFVKSFRRDNGALKDCLNLCLIALMLFSFVFEPIGSNTVFYLYVILISIYSSENVDS